MQSKDGTGQPRTRRDESDLGSLLNPLQDGLVGRVGETAVVASFHVVLVSRTQPLWTIVESITKWFVNAFECITLSHEDLPGGQLHCLHLVPSTD